MRRSWLFVAGADEAAHETAARSGADVIVLELEDFTPPDLRPKARARRESIYKVEENRGARSGSRQPAGNLRPRRSQGRHAGAA
jgi:citrate lyase beta subunit